MNKRIVCLASVMLGLLLPPSVHAQSLSLEDLEREGRLLAGFDLVAQRHFPEAMPIFTAVLGSGDASQAARALAGIGDCQLETGKESQAVSSYLQALKRSAGCLPALEGLARAAVRNLLPFDQGVPYAQQAEKAFSGDPSVFYLRAAAVSANGSVAAALGYLRRAFHLGFGDWTLIEKDPHLAGIRASAEYRSFVGKKENVDRARTLKEQGRVQLEKGNTAEAATVLQESLQLYMDAGWQLSLDTAEIVEHISAITVAAGLAEQASSFYQVSLQLKTALLGGTHPEVAWTHVQVGEMQRKIGKPAEARDSFETALGMYEGTIGLWNERALRAMVGFGASLAEAGEMEEGIKVLESAVMAATAIFRGEDPRLVPALQELGSALGKIKEYKKAAGALEKALAIQRAKLGGDALVLVDTLRELGSMYAGAGELERAVERVTEALAIAERREGKESLNAAWCHFDIADSLQKLQRYEDAIPHLERSLAVLEKIAGANHAIVITTRKQLAGIFNLAGKYDQAIKAYEDLLAVYQRAGKAQSPESADCYKEMGDTYHLAGNRTRALAAYEKALPIYRKACGEEDKRTLECLQRTGEMHEETGAYDQAATIYQKVLAVRKKLHGEKNPAVAESYIALAGLASKQRQSDKAIQLYRTAIGILEQSLGAGDLRVAEAWGGLGLVYWGIKDLDQAIVCYSRELELYEANPKAGALERGEACTDLGDAYEARGEFERAIGYFERALALMERALGSENLFLGYQYSKLGGAYLESGDVDKAIGYYEKALARWGTNPEGNLEFQAACYRGLGAAYTGRNDPKKAVAMFTRSLELRARVLGESHFELAPDYNNIAAAYGAAGDHERKIAMLGKAIALMEPRLGKEHPELSPYYFNLGVAYASRNDYPSAIASAARALNIAKRAGVREEISDYSIAVGLFQLYVGKIKEAKGTLEDGIRAIEVSRVEAGAGKIEVLARNIVHYYCSLMASARLGDTEGVFSVSERMRSRGFLDRLSLEAALTAEGISQADREKMLALNDEIESLAARRLEEMRKPLADQNRTTLLSLVQDLERKEKEFAQRESALLTNERYRTLRNPRIATLAEAQRACDAETAILVYVIWEEDDPEQVSYAFKQSYCMVVRNASVELVPLDRDFPYTKTVMEFRGEIVNAGSRRDSVAALLEGKLVTPLAKALQGVRRLIIVPDGALAFLPFDALRSGPNGQYLCERFTVSLTPSVSVLLMVKGRPQAKARVPFLAFGGAVYSSAAGQSRGRRASIAGRGASLASKRYQAAGSERKGLRGYYENLGITWDNLPGTREEVETIDARVFTNKGTKILKGSDVSELRVKDLSRSGELARYQVVHFACHGYYDPDIPSCSAVVFSEVARPPGGPAGEDGYLSVEEVVMLKLDADIVNLSACETGLGKVVQGDGVVGLARAFQVAGAAKVGVTLWQVADDATRDFMVSVYDKVVKQGLTYPEALSRTKREFLRGEFSDPYYWSPFVLYGE